jgi:hypothetical protein
MPHGLGILLFHGKVHKINVTLHLFHDWTTKLDDVENTLDLRHRIERPGYNTQSLLYLMAGKG